MANHESQLTAFDTGHPLCIVVSMWPKSTIAEHQWGARNHAESHMHNSRTGLSCSCFSLGSPQPLVMALGVTHSDVLQQLGVTYPQLIDYSSEAYTASLVSPTMPCRSLFTYICRYRFRFALWFWSHGTILLPCMYFPAFHLDYD